ncbi:MAG: class I SAM-dependent methyltransferase [Oligoflexia bacterium]|nr:class I SAM-dependent methyltransferase [Oligoflexia bacterium]
MIKMIRKVELHPETQKRVRQGHPWITKDSFTDKFPVEEDFLLGGNTLFLHDPHHKLIKGRVWKHPFLEKSFSKEQFSLELFERISCAIKKRIDLNLQRERDNFYLIFSEIDLLPGLKVLHVKDKIFIQIYALFWEKYREILTAHLQKVLCLFWPQKTFSLFIQYRLQNKIDVNNPAAKERFIIKEYGIGLYYDLSLSVDAGIYTDMSSIRQELLPYFSESQNILNLYAHTGAFSLLALKCGEKKRVVSVDLSKKYLKALEENLSLNPDLLIPRGNTHENRCTSVEEYLRLAIKNKKECFDLIISDPSSCSSDGSKLSKAIASQIDSLALLHKLLTDNGHVILFLNTHKITLHAFKTKIAKAIAAKGMHFSEVKYLSMSKDCPISKNFPEGNYIKGVILRKLR